MNLNHMVLYLAASQEILELTCFFTKSKPNKQAAHLAVTLEFGNGYRSSSLGREKLRREGPRHRSIPSLVTALEGWGLEHHS